MNRAVTREQRDDLAPFLGRAYIRWGADAAEAVMGAYHAGRAHAGYGTANELLEEAMHLAMNGERAPGGNETWREWFRKTEAYLRSLMDEGGDDGT